MLCIGLLSSWMSVCILVKFVVCSVGFLIMLLYSLVRTFHLYSVSSCCKVGVSVLGRKVISEG